MDITNGSVVLTLTAYGPDNNVTDNLNLQINMAAVASAGEDASPVVKDPLSFHQPRLQIIFLLNGQHQVMELLMISAC